MVIVTQSTGTSDQVIRRSAYAFNTVPVSVALACRDDSADSINFAISSFADTSIEITVVLFVNTTFSAFSTGITHVAICAYACYTVEYLVLSSIALNASSIVSVPVEP